jgi:hypothetical protein
MNFAQSRTGVPLDTRITNIVPKKFSPSAFDACTPARLPRRGPRPFAAPSGPFALASGPNAVQTAREQLLDKVLYAPLEWRFRLSYT